MTTIVKLTLPDHTQLPESNGEFVKNFQEHPQSVLLTDTIAPVLDRIHPDGNYCIGQDSGIYWRLAEPLEKGAEAPDWFYVSNVPATLDGVVRRSYVMWQEYISPLLALEFVSGNGTEERDRTPIKGKFWVYEQAIRIPYYGIYEVEKASIEMYQLVGESYTLMSPNDRGHYEIAPMQVEIGIWQGIYQNMNLPWLRWWDLEGNLLLTGSDRADLEQQRAETAEQHTYLEKQRADTAEQRLAELEAKMRSLGIDPSA
jgi:Uma2 family endonuclease